MTAIISCDHSSVKSKTFIAFSKMISLSDPTFPFRGPWGRGSDWLWFSAPAFVPAAPHVHCLTRELSAIPGIRYCYTGMLVLDYTPQLFFLTQSYMQLRGIRICLFYVIISVLTTAFNSEIVSTLEFS